MCIVVLRCLFQDHNHSHKLKSQWSQANVSEMHTMVCQVFTVGQHWEG